ncbi:hypothetical protein Tsubulata_036083 [Turnera subulata]|uniref:Methyl-CpG-binding domain-containing protein 9 n=1 Tax=Turnera subulata TaxID=218843 RepID=A0A9Q0FFU8_9ROSI|nr:hypothetical protein Tsubulata_036083 [Turnera subulata]
MELTDPPSESATRSPLFIDLNEIPSASSSSPPGQPSQPDPYPLDLGHPDSFDVVRSIHDNPDPAPGIAAGLPRETSEAGCGSCGLPEEPGHVVVCDGCERGFHLGCAGMHGRQAACLTEWLCAECMSDGVKSKRWPLGVKSKQILDINASPPSDGDVESADDQLASRKHALHSMYAGNGFGAKKGSEILMQAFRLGFEDIMHNAPTAGANKEEVDLGFPLARFRSSGNSDIRLPAGNPSEIFLRGLREFISERHGVLEEGWRVEFRQSITGYDLYVVYCSPDGKTFGSMSEVACHLGLMPTGNSAGVEAKGDMPPYVQESLRLPKKRKSRKISAANGFSENKEYSANCYHSELLPNGHIMETCDPKSAKVVEVEMEEDDVDDSQASNEGLPVQFEDFFVLSLGKIDPRPSYHDDSLIWPVGYRSCWHDKVTGSLFMCEVLDGGDSGPVFKIRRLSCSTFPVPDGLTVLFLSNLSNCADQNGKENIKANFDDIDRENDGSVVGLLADLSPPTDNDILQCLHHSSDQTPESLQNTSLDISSCKEVGEISVVEHSSSLAWRMMSQKLTGAYSEIYRRWGTIKLSCNHAHNEIRLPVWDKQDENSNVKFSSLAKFCSSPSNMECNVEDLGELDALTVALSEWLIPDRFGLDTEFVQEMIEQLPGVEVCSKYDFLVNRSQLTTCPTVRNGLLMAKRKGDVECSDSFQRSKRPRLAENKLVDDSYLPPGKPLSSKVPPVLVGDFYQVWEFLCRFHEILGLNYPFLLEELEEELINPWSEGSDLSENLGRKVHRSQVIESERVDRMSQNISISSDEYRLPPSGDDSRSVIQVETGTSKNESEARSASAAHYRCFGVALTKAHRSMLDVLVSELQSKVAPLVDPNFDCGETKPRRGRRKDVDSSMHLRRSKLSMLPINELTWPELARRYVLAVLTMDGNLDSAEITSRESGKVFRCLQGDGGVLCGSLTGVTGLEADALLLAEATKQVFGSLSQEKDVFTIQENADTSSACDTNNTNDGIVPEWAQVLEPVRKLPTNVGTRIRKCVYEALERNPPEWAKKRLEHSISKEVYKGNASGPTKKAVLSVLADLLAEGLPQKSEKRNIRAISIPRTDIIMKRCRIVLRRAAADDDEKVFCTLLGRSLISSNDNDDEGLLGSPAMVSRPLDFRTIDFRLAVGAYGGSHESFVEDVRELWNHVRIAFADQQDLVELADSLSQSFESLYEKEVVSIVNKLDGYSKLDCISAEAKKELDDILASSNEIPKAPWDEGVCKVCGVDKDDDSVLLCDTCDAEYHTYCLNPPLARIPEGNWYCPSCAVGLHKAQGPSGSTRVIGQSRRKKYQGEGTRVYLDMLAHLGAAMEEKEYWELSLDERIYLLKFLCDELLNSALVRLHLEQCAEMTAELQQKLRSYTMDWKNLKSKEEFLLSRASKMGASSVGEACVNGGLSSASVNQNKFSGPAPTVGDRLRQFSTFSSDMQAQDGVQEENGINGLHKNLSVTDSEKNHCYTSQTVNPALDTDNQVPDLCAGVDDNSIPSQENNRSSEPNPSALPNHLPQLTDDVGETQLQGNLKGHLATDSSTLLIAHLEPRVEMNSLVSQPLSSVALAESQFCDPELNSTKNDIIQLENSISNIWSQLSKLSIRREFLGSDSRGRLYWASPMPERHLRIIVDGSLTLQQERISDCRDLRENGSLLSDSDTSGMNTCLHLEGSEAPFPFQCNPNNAMAMCSPWVSYESDAEIEELIGGLKDSDHKERELKESIQWRKLRFLEHQQNRNREDQQAVFPVVTDDNKITFSLVSKASMFLEAKYGPPAELDPADQPKRPGKKGRVTSCEDKIYRCCCLELILPSQYHCLSCHRTFLDDVALEQHNDGRCSLDSPAFEKIESGNDSSRMKGPVTIQKELVSQMNRTETTKSGWSGPTSTLIKFEGEGMKCPYELEEISAKFVTNDSNKELVEGIGLIGSNGFPSFVPSISPSVSDSTLLLIRPQTSTGILGDEGRSFGEAIAERHSSRDDSCSKSANNEVGKASETGKPPLRCLEEKKVSSSKHFSKYHAASCCVVPQSSLRPLVGKVLHILRQLKINMLDMECALPEEAIKPSKAQVEMRWAWRSYVKSADSIYKMVLATVVLEEMIKTEYLRNEWWYWSSLSAAAKTSTVASLALRIYALDAAIVYEKGPSNSDTNNSLKPISSPEQKLLPCLDPSDKIKTSRKSNRKRKELEG